MSALLVWVLGVTGFGLWETGVLDFSGLDLGVCGLLGMMVRLPG